jgi:hypothetical protein
VLGISDNETQGTHSKNYLQTFPIEKNIGCKINIKKHTHTNTTV